MITCHQGRRKDTSIKTAAAIIRMRKNQFFEIPMGNAISVPPL
jgi:hypothetical protein